MKHLTIICSTFITILLSIDSKAQVNQNPKKLTDFSFMIGDWEGTGTYYSQRGAEVFTVEESIVYTTDSTTLLIRGQGFDNKGVIHHDALGVMYFDNGKFYMHAFTKEGLNTIADVSLTGVKAFDWGFELPNGGKISYSTTFTENTWEESGTYTTPDGTQSFPTMQMKLSRK